MTDEDIRQTLLDEFFEPYKVLFFEVDGFRAERFLDNPDTFGDFGAIFLGLRHPEDDPQNFILISQFVQKANGRPVFVMPTYDIPDVQRLCIEHGASGVIWPGLDGTHFQNAVDEAKLLMEKYRNLPIN